MEHLLPYALVLICPVSMGAMMWVMMRGDKNQGAERAQLERRVQELEAEKGASVAGAEPVPDLVGRHS